MAEVEIRVLRRNASAVVAKAAAGEIITITDSGRPVARLTPIGRSRVQTLVDSGHARPLRSSLAELAVPEPGAALSGELAAMRNAERY